MANFIVSYDLNRLSPTHAEMDEHIRSQGWSCARILETVWYVGGSTNADTIYHHLKEILTDNDPIIVAEVGYAVFDNLLYDHTDLVNAFHRHS